jgi:hypothetical protein
VIGILIVAVCVIAFVVFIGWVRRYLVKKIIATIALSLSFLGMAACSGTNHDAGNPTVDIVIHWWRVETPPSVVTEFFGCFGTTGLLLDQGDGNVANTPNDPMCPKNGAPYQLVQRHGTDPAINIGSYRLIPPDNTGKYGSINGKV